MSANGRGDAADASAEGLRVKRLSARQLLRGPEIGGPTPGDHPGQRPVAGNGGSAADGSTLQGDELERYVEERVLTTTMERAVAWARSNSFFPATFGLACCVIEMMTAVTARLDIARFGFEAFRASPRQADLLIISGRVSIKMAPIVRRIYDQMLEPKWVIAMGACSSSMGIFNNYAIVPADKFLPVDVHVPGCPPRPEALMHGVLKLRDLVQQKPQPGWRERYGATGTEELAGPSENGAAAAIDVFRRGA